MAMTADQLWQMHVGDLPTPQAGQPHGATAIAALNASQATPAYNAYTSNPISKFLVDNLPTAGGILGGIGGTVVGPAGSIAGAGGGSALGEALRQHLTGTSGLDYGKIGTQGAIGAVADAGGQVLGKVLGGVASKLGSGATATGEDLLAGSRGLTPAAKAGPKVLSTDAAKAANEYVSSVTSATAPKQVLSDLEAHINDVGSQIGGVIKDSNASLSKAEIKALKTDATAAVAKVPGLGEDRAAVQQYVTDLAKNNDIAGLQSYKQALDGQINFNKLNSGTTGKMNQALAEIRDVVKTYIGDRVPALAPLNSQFSQAKNALPFIQSAVSHPQGFKALGMNIGGGTVEAVKGAAGKALTNVGGAIGNTAQGLSDVLAKAGGLGNVATQTIARNLPQDQGQQLPNTMPTMPQTTTDQTPQQPQISLQNVLSAMAADPKNASLYKQMYDMQVAANKADMTPKQQQSQTDIGDAFSYLQSAEQQLTQAGGAKGAFGNATDIPIAGQYINPAGSAYQQTKVDIATALAKALTGNSRPAAQVINMYMHSLPSVTDTPQVAAQKLQNVRLELMNKAKQVGVPTDLYTTGQ